MQLEIYRDNGSIPEELFDTVEKQINYSFPESYKKVVIKHDGLRLENNIFDFTNIYGEADDRGINFLSFNSSNVENIIAEQHISDPEYAGIPHLVAFGIAGNGDYICFDYRDNPKGNNPKVVLMYHDDHIENDDGTLSMVVNFVANDFEEFMDMLHE